MSALLILTVLVVGEPTSAFDGGVAAYEAGRFGDARILFAAALEDPAVAPGPVLYNLGNCAYRQGLHAEAVLFYRRALLRMPRDEQVLFNLRRSEGHLGLDDASVESFGAVAIGVADALTPSELLGIVLGLQVVGFVGFVLFRRRALAFRVACVLIVAVGILGGARLVYRQWLASPDGVVLSEEITVRAEPHASLPATLELRAGEVVRVEELSDRWVRVVHPRGGGWTERSGVGVVD